ncbi:ROK family transcriptional regulator [Gracilibacillus alcaliphilus]|uniref:ROK family transcriptional regulator n=1 Tax=Gracilibacillus alcaliphilus TaxID=1401441 RepID=UPI001959D812|nr:ROK family transcriptional regulator [Gracilibacillus alcaliphilus]MBM7677461.1 putative NBD/HSP70 family sugar kinase [Gracilibacillus alcaliphilus]
MKRTGDLKLIQELNRSIILETIRKHGPISRSEIAKQNELSPTTVTSAVAELINDGYVSESGTGISRGGRRPILLEFSPNNHYLIGVSISYTKITIADINLEAKINIKKIYPTKGYTGVTLINYLLQLLEDFYKLRQDHRICIGISIIIQGIVDAKKGIVHYNPVLLLEDVYLRDSVEYHFRLPTWLDNDTNAYVLAEKNFGRFQDIENLIYITIGEGVGAGVIANHHLCRGEKGGTGELGHTSIDVSGKVCGCGNRGCLENYVSWPATSNRIMKRILEGCDTQLTDYLTNNKDFITPAEFVEAVNEGDGLAIEVTHEIAEYLSAGIVNVVHLFNPQVIILGGDVTNQNQLLIESLREKLRQKTLKTLYKDLYITTSSLGKEFEMVGAASVLLQDKFQFKLTHDHHRLKTSL